MQGEALRMSIQDSSFHRRYSKYNYRVLPIFNSTHVRILSGHSRQKTHCWPATTSGRVVSKMTSKRRWSHLDVHLFKHFITRHFRLTCWRAIFTRWRRFTSSGSSSGRGWATWPWRGSSVCDPGPSRQWISSKYKHFQDLRRSSGEWLIRVNVCK